VIKIKETRQWSKNVNGTAKKEGKTARQKVLAMVTLTLTDKDLLLYQIASR